MFCGGQFVWPKSTLVAVKDSVLEVIKQTKNKKQKKKINESKKLKHLEVVKIWKGQCFLVLSCQVSEGFGRKVVVISA